MLPSATQQWVAGLGGHIDDALSGRISQTIADTEAKVLANADKIHRTRLHEPEEDDAYLIHIFASGFIQLIFPREELKALGRLDLMEDKNRREIMGFYKKCVQRLMKVSGKGRRLLSKNPNFTTKISTLNETFPDAHFIYLVRHPEDAIGSIHSMVTRIWKSQGMSIKEGDSSRREGLVEWAEFLYKHGVDNINSLPKERVTVVRYEDLIPRPDEEVERVYKELGMEISPAFRQSLKAAREKSKSHSSKHHYSLDEFGLSREEVEDRLDFVFKQFAYESRG